MSTFTARFAETQSTSTNNRPHAEPSPASNSDLFRLLSDQLSTLVTNTTSTDHRHLLESLLDTASENTIHPPRKIEGVDQAFLDTLERVPKKALKPEDTCGICAEPFLGDEWPLVVELPCGSKVRHAFDLECVAPWLKLNGTCPMDRVDLRRKKAPIVDVEPEEEEWDDDYA